MNRARRPAPWPFPGPATPADRARTISQGYRALALEFAKELDDVLGYGKWKDKVDQLDQLAVNLGELWVRPVVTTGEDRIDRAEFAALAQVSPGAVSVWSSRPPSWGTCPPRGPDGKYDRAEVVAFLLARDTRRAGGPPPAAPTPEVSAA